MALWEARRKKERTYREMMGHNRRARLVVSQLARAKVRGETNLMCRRVELAWRLRWVPSWLYGGQDCGIHMLWLPGARGADGTLLPHRSRAGRPVRGLVRLLR